ncbi:hypothetical protein GCM10011614_09360 [Novosphingobium colocasiae]|uniref:Glucuronosyltransferase n=2 Tax=Novosphingobium colocasiae TaxID=1256513 RepID=A0A918UEA8_9SPHN|nr:hypothetical protein GCM10011614_09360 [Novosphingobium colocasiae]
MRVMAVASGGGHWDELMLLHPAYAGCDVTYVTTFKGMADRDGIDAALLLPDANRDNPGDAWRCLVASVKLIRRHRPEVLITTGALPGLFCLIVARLLGARTIWIDSIANYEVPSLSGRIALPFASLWLTQWPHLANGRKRKYCGALL